MLVSSINPVAGIGIVALLIGVAGQPTILIGGCVLVGSALIAAAVESLNRK